MNIIGINKIAIIGGPGTGKTTLSENLGKQLNLPVYHLDGIHHLENWNIRDSEERDRIILEKVSQSKWVIDGTYKSTLQERIRKADLIIFLNYSTLARLKGIFSRYFKNKNKDRKEIPGCKEKMDLEFIKLTINWSKTKGNVVKELLDKNIDKKIIIFNNRKQLNKWYKKEFKNPIIIV